MKIKQIIIILILILLNFKENSAKILETLDAHKITLKNGMSLILKEDHSNPLVSINLYVKTGSINENKKNNGISHLYEHLFFRGTYKRSGMQMKKELEGFGGKINAQTNKDFTHYYVNLPSFHYKEALEIILDALINNNFNPQELEKERAVVLNEYKIGLEDYFNQIIQTLYDYHFKNHPYKLPVIGTELSLKSLTREDLINYKEKYYTPDNVFLVILGDFEEEELKKYLENLLINFKETNKINYQNLTNEPLKESLTEIIEEKDLSFGILALGFNVVSVKNQDVYAVDILTFLLGQGDGAYLNKNLVEDKKIFDQINVDFTTSRDPGILIILGSFSKTDIPKIKASLFEEIEKIKKGDFKEEDFKRAKNLLINNFIFSTETLSGRSETLGFYEAIDNFQFAQNYLDEIEKITKEKIIKAAQKYLNFNKAALIIYKPKK